MGEVPRAGNDSGGGQLGNRRPLQAARRERLALRRRAGSRLGGPRERIGPDVGVPDLATDPRVATIAERRKNQQLVWTLLNKFAEKYTKRELMAILNPLDVPCGPIMSTEDLATDEHVRGRDMWVELDHPQRGKWFNVGMPIKLSDSPAQIERSPTLGEHTDEILRECSATTIEDRCAEERGRVLRAAEEGRMKIAIIGQQDFGKAVLEAFLARGDQVAGVFLRAGKAGRAPRRAEGRGAGKGVQACSSSRRSRATRRRRR
jgi:crotonobetainyl-CoA:carnitine CoA-transferase CaiB-like acyl-CoA transferase